MIYAVAHCMLSLLPIPTQKQFLGYRRITTGQHGLGSFFLHALLKKSVKSHIIFFCEYAYFKSKVNEHTIGKLMLPF